MRVKRLADWLELHGESPSPIPFVAAQGAVYRKAGGTKAYLSEFERLVSLDLWRLSCTARGHSATVQSYELWRAGAPADVWSIGEM